MISAREHHGREQCLFGSQRICTFCDRSFDSFEDWTKHRCTLRRLQNDLLWCSVGDRQSDKSEKQEITALGCSARDLGCRQCGKHFASRLKLRKHQRQVHERRLVCGWDGCTLGFSDAFKLAEHRRVHQKTKVHSCDHCGRRFTDRRNLKRHVDSVHLRLKPFRCGVCSKSFTRKYGLKIHRCRGNTASL